MVFIQYDGKSWVHVNDARTREIIERRVGNHDSEPQVFQHDQPVEFQLYSLCKLSAVALIGVGG